MVFQSFNLFAHKTILENVTLGPIKVRGVSKADADKRGLRAPRAGGRRPPGREVPRPALRRPAAARRDRPRAGHGAQGDALRRAHLRARPRDDQGGARRDGRPREAGHDHGRRHPRDGLRPHRRRPRALHGRRRRSSRRTPPRSSSPTRSPSAPRTSSARSSSTDRRPAAGATGPGTRRRQHAIQANQGESRRSRAGADAGRLRRRRHGHQVRRRRGVQGREVRARHPHGRARRQGHHQRRREVRPAGPGLQRDRRRTCPRASTWTSPRSWSRAWASTRTTPRRPSTSRPSRTTASPSCRRARSTSCSRRTPSPTSVARWSARPART